MNDLINIMAVFNRPTTTKFKKSIYAKTDFETCPICGFEFDLGDRYFQHCSNCGADCEAIKVEEVAV